MLPETVTPPPMLAEPTAEPPTAVMESLILPTVRNATPEPSIATPPLMAVPQPAFPISADKDQLDSSTSLLLSLVIEPVMSMTVLTHNLHAQLELSG